LNKFKVILNGPPLDECALARIDQLGQLGCKYVSKNFGEELPHDVNERYGTVILDRRGFSGLRQQHHQSHIDAMEILRVQMLESIEHEHKV
jgi:hypothetical protein